MRVFVTGATGFVGSAVVSDLLANGHQVVGMARSAKKAEDLKAKGAEVHFGDIYDLDSVSAGAKGVDGIIHTAFDHDFSRYKDNCELDRRVIGTLGSVIDGTDIPMVITSGTGVLGISSTSTERDKPAFDSSVMPRVASEEAAAALVAKGLNVSVMRLPPSTHGAGDHGFVYMLMELARQKGLVAYAGDGSNVWPAAHRADAASLYRLALERRVADVYHAVAEEGVRFGDIARTIAAGLDLPLKSLSKEETADHFGWFAHFASMNCPSSSELSRSATGWQPREIGLLADMEAHYFGK